MVLAAKQQLDNSLDAPLEESHTFEKKTRKVWKSKRASKKVLPESANVTSSSNARGSGPPVVLRSHQQDTPLSSTATSRVASPTADPDPMEGDNMLREGCDGGESVASGVDLEHPTPPSHTGQNPFWSQEKLLPEAMRKVEALALGLYHKCLQGLTSREDCLITANYLSGWSTYMGTPEEKAAMQHRQQQ